MKQVVFKTGPHKIVCLVRRLSIFKFLTLYIFFQLDCCGFDGPKEFAYNNEPIDDSCYDDVTGANSGIVSRREDLTTAKKMKQV